MAAQPPPARHPPRSLARQGGCPDRLRVVAPDIDLRLLGVLRDDPLMLGQHRIDPGRRRAAVGQLLDDPGEQAEPALHPAKPPGLQNPQDARRMVFGDGFGRQHPRGGRARCPLCEEWDQPPRTLQHCTLIVGQEAVIPGRRDSGAACHALPHLGKAAMLPQPLSGHAWFSGAANSQPADCVSPYGRIEAETRCCGLQRRRGSGWRRLPM
jgi:hypothetical protein